MLALAEPAAAAVGVRKLTSAGVRTVRVSETMRLSESGHQVLGVWEGGDGAIIVRRDQLAQRRSSAGCSCTNSGTRGPVRPTVLSSSTKLTRLLGLAAAAAVSRPATAP